MSLPVIGLIVFTTLLVVGVLVAVTPTDEPDLEAAPARESKFTTPNAIRLLWSLGIGIIVVTISGWLVPAVVIAVATWHWIGTWQQRDRSGVNDVERTDALASWIENLRDVLLAGDQPIGAITATVSTAPPIIRPAVRRLAAALGHQHPDTAFRRFADELNDPLGDLVASGLLIAVERGARTVGVLSALAEQARTTSDRRRIVEAERAPIRREVTLLSLIMGGLVIALVVFGRGDYLDAYDTGGGQVFLTVILSIYAVLLLRVQQLARFPKPSRFLTSAGGRARQGLDVAAGSTR